MSTSPPSVPDPHVPRPFITVVSGLPRSGTSMMMQVLDFGGVPPITDDRRAADDDNTRGYFELESVKKIAVDASFLDDAEGRSVKLIHALVTKLPVGRRYRVIFLRRPTAQVLASQATMLERSGKKGAALPPEKLAAIFDKQVEDTLRTLAGREDVSVLELDYPAVIADPRKAVEQIDRFLGGGLDTDAMASAIDPKLFRNRH